MSEDADNQQEVFGFLADPATHGGQEESGGSIRTRHPCSSPATVPSRSSAPCAFPFSTIRRSAKRKQACEAEIAVNAPYAPEIYRGVVAITREAVGKARHRRSRHAGRMGGRYAALR